MRSSGEFRHRQGHIGGLDLLQQKAATTRSQQGGRLGHAGGTDGSHGMGRWVRGNRNPIQLLAFVKGYPDGVPLRKRQQPGLIAFGSCRADAADTFQGQKNPPQVGSDNSSISSGGVLRLQPMPSTRLRGLRISRLAGWVWGGRATVGDKEIPARSAGKGLEKGIEKGQIAAAMKPAAGLAAVVNHRDPLPVQHQTVERFYAGDIVDYLQPCSLASISKEGSWFASVAVVITGRALVRKAQRSASSFAPPKWPESSEIEKEPASSITTTAGSVCLDFSNGAIMRTTIPVAMINKPIHLPPEGRNKRFQVARLENDSRRTGLTGIAPGHMQFRPRQSFPQPPSQRRQPLRVMAITAVRISDHDPSIAMGKTSVIQQRFGLESWVPGAARTSPTTISAWRSIPLRALWSRYRPGSPG